MMIETDAEFVERISDFIRRQFGIADGTRIRALARRGAAADAEIDRLRSALRDIAGMIPYAMPDYTHQVWKTARAALEENE